MKKTTALLLSLLSACSLAACGSREQETKSSDSVMTVDTSDFDGQTELSETEDTEEFMELSSPADSQDSTGHSGEDSHEITENQDVYKFCLLTPVSEPLAY